MNLSSHPHISSRPTNASQLRMQAHIPRVQAVSANKRVLAAHAHASPAGMLLSIAQQQQQQQQQLNNRHSTSPLITSTEVATSLYVLLIQVAGLCRLHG